MVKSILPSPLQSTATWLLLWKSWYSVLLLAFYWKAAFTQRTYGWLKYGCKDMAKASCGKELHVFQKMLSRTICMIFKRRWNSFNLTCLKCHNACRDYFEENMQKLCCLSSSKQSSHATFFSVPAHVDLLHAISLCYHLHAN